MSAASGGEPPDRIAARVTAGDVGAPNVARGRPALQSSVSPWSRAPTVESDAAGAVTGQPSGSYGFHTEREDRPWWRVDLGAPHRIDLVVVHNRAEPELRGRALPLEISLSTDGEEFVLVHRQSDEFGAGATGDALRWVPGPDSPGITAGARHLRLQIDRHDYLHLDQVEIHGAPVAETLAPDPAPEAAGQREGVGEGEIAARPEPVAPPAPPPVVAILADHRQANPDRDLPPPPPPAFAPEPAGDILGGDDDAASERFTFVDHAASTYGMAEEPLEPEQRGAAPRAAPPARGWLARLGRSLFGD